MFKILSVKLWSKLDESIIDVPSFNTFKKLIFDNLIKQQSCVLYNQYLNTCDDICDYSCIDGVVNRLLQNT